MSPNHINLSLELILEMRRGTSKNYNIYTRQKKETHTVKLTNFSERLQVLSAGMIILWHIMFPLLTLIFISVAFAPRPLGTGMQTLLSPLLKVPRIVLLSSFL